MYKDLDIKFYKITNIQNIFKFLNEENFSSILFLDHSMNNISQALINNKLAKNYFVFGDTLLPLAQKIWTIL